MKTLVIGTHDSGKSALAEELALKTGDSRRYYLATMIVLDDAGRERVQRHRLSREGKGFITIERPLDITGILAEMEDAADSVVLLECMANLVGNEMHRVECPDPEPHTEGILQNMGRPDAEQFADSIMSDIECLAENVHNLIIVTDEYEKDGPGYTDAARDYVKRLDMVNERLLDFADVVYDLRKTGFV